MIIFQDTFEGYTGAVTSRTSDSGHAWSSTNAGFSTFHVRDGYAAPNVTSGSQAAYGMANVPAGIEDVAIEGNFWFNGASANNRIMRLYLHSFQSTGATAFGLVIARVSGAGKIGIQDGAGGYTELPITIDLNTLYNVRLERIAGVARAYLNDVEVVSIPSTASLENWMPYVLIPAITDESYANRVHDIVYESLGALPTDDADTAFPAFRSSAVEGSIGTSNASLPLLRTSAISLDGETSINQRLRAVSTMTAQQVLSAALNAGATLTDALGVGRVVPADMLDSVSAVPVMSAAGEFGASMQSTVQVVTATLPDGSPIAWVVHTDMDINNIGNDKPWDQDKLSMPSTMYDAYGYNSFAFFDGKYYGAKDDGIYELTGATDAGKPVIAQLLLPKDDIGTNHKKRMRAVYAAMKADGDITVTVEVDDGNTYDYTLPASASLANTRAMLGRGLSSQYWQITLTNEDGADFTLDGIYLFAEPTNRRI